MKTSIHNPKLPIIILTSAVVLAAFGILTYRTTTQQLRAMVRTQQPAAIAWLKAHEQNIVSGISTVKTDEKNTAIATTAVSATSPAPQQATSAVKPTVAKPKAKTSAVDLQNDPYRLALQARYLQCDLTVFKTVPISGQIQWYGISSKLNTLRWRQAQSDWAGCPNLQQQLANWANTHYSYPLDDASSSAFFNTYNY